MLAQEFSIDVTIERLETNIRDDYPLRMWAMREWRERLENAGGSPVPGGLIALASGKAQLAGPAIVAERPHPLGAQFGFVWKVTGWAIPPAGAPDYLGASVFTLPAPVTGEPLAAGPSQGAAILPEPMNDRLRAFLAGEDVS